MKYANLIFVEHKKLLTENEYLYDQVDNLNHLNIQNQEIDRLRLQQLNIYEKENEENLLKIDNLSKEINKKNRSLTYWKVGGITVSVALVLFLLLR